MDEQVKPKAQLTMKSLQERIATLETELEQLKLKHGLLYEAHQALQQDFQEYKDKGKWTKQDVQELAKLLAEHERLQGQHPLIKKLLRKRPEG